MIGRIVIDDVRPRTPSGEYPAKAVVGETVEISADIYKDGHDVLAARVRWRPAGSKKWSDEPMQHLGSDRWSATIEPSELGRHELVVEAWVDRYATWRHKAVVKLEAGQEIEVELEEGALLAELGAESTGKSDAQQLRSAATQARDTSASTQERLGPLITRAVEHLLHGPLPGSDLTSAAAVPLWVDRERALFGAWYEFFPRSEGGLQGAAKRLAAVAAMGFDVVYFPPIHPIGQQFRKGKNNTLDPTPEDVGSPWAIGGAEGGHMDIHPELGSFDDFAEVVRRADELGMEIALDYALQCSPDHPWVREHPEWFHHRPDGTIAYAENPPKKYQDIYPINFWPEREEDRVALWEACREILEFWIERGVRIFRVDNPHTKPFAFWAWLIAEIQKVHPDVLFLAEAFTRPKVMAKLAEIGFSQSYTYFTWRTEQHGPEGLVAYLTELAGEKADYMRPNFWPNTPDILSGPLRNGSPAAFKMRFVLAATMTPAYGLYSGYELYENAPAAETNEEYLNSEKYEVKERDWSQPNSLTPFITKLNDIRRRHPAMQRLRNITFHASFNDQMIAYSKHTDDFSDVILCVVNLDPHSIQETTLQLDLGALGIPNDRPFEAHDELTGQTFTWQGGSPYVRLDPHWEPAHVLHLRAPRWHG